MHESNNEKLEKLMRYQNNVDDYVAEEQALQIRINEYLNVDGPNKEGRNTKNEERNIKKYGRQEKDTKEKEEKRNEKKPVEKKVQGEKKEGQMKKMGEEKKEGEKRERKQESGNTSKNEQGGRSQDKKGKSTDKAPRSEKQQANANKPQGRKPQQQPNASLTTAAASTGTDTFNDFAIEIKQAKTPLGLAEAYISKAQDEIKNAAIGQEDTDEYRAAEKKEQDIKAGYMFAQKKMPAKVMALNMEDDISSEESKEHDDMELMDAL